MFYHYRTEGFLFKKEPRGESDEILILFTKDFGRLEILAKGVKKIKSKLRGNVNLFYLSRIEFIQGKVYKTLTDTALIEKFEDIRKNLLKLKLVFALSELMDNLLIEQEKDERAWGLLTETLFKINEKKIRFSAVRLLYYYFFWNLISILGYRPELYNCSFCKKKIKPDEIYFSSKEGGLVCPNCFKKDESVIKIKPEAVKILRFLIERDLPILEKLKLENKHFEELESVTKNFFSFLLKRKNLIY